MTTVEINGEALKVKVTAPGSGLAEAAEAALRIHRRVCAGIAARERAEERRRVIRVPAALFGFKQPENDTDDDPEDDPEDGDE